MSMVTPNGMFNSITCKTIILVFIYLPPFDSHFYDNKTYHGIKLLESLLLELSQEFDYELIICGDLNARVGTPSEIIETDINVPALEEFENVFQT